MSSPGSAVSVEPAGDGKVCVTVDDRSFLVADTCPHRDGRLLYGYVNAVRLRITCPLHRSSFDLVTGEVLSGPSEAPLATEELPCQHP